MERRLVEIGDWKFIRRLDPNVPNAVWKTDIISKASGTVRNWLRVGVEVYALDVGKIESELDIVLVIKGWQGSDERKKIRE